MNAQAGRKIHPTEKRCIVSLSLVRTAALAVRLVVVIVCDCSQSFDVESSTDTMTSVPSVNGYNRKVSCEARSTNTTFSVRKTESQLR